MAPTGPPGQPADPFRLLFDRLRSGAARCRLRLEGDRVSGAEVLDENTAFAAVRHILSELTPMFARVRTTGSETLVLEAGAAHLSISAFTTGVDEVMVVVDDVPEVPAPPAHDFERRFHQAFHGNGAAMVIATRDTLKILDVNARWLELMGETREHAIGRTPVELVQMSEADVVQRVAEHRAHLRGFESELLLRTHGGELRYVLASAKPIELPEGACTLTTLIDITARKQAEEAFEVAFDASPAGMMLVDASTHAVVAVNRHMLELTRQRRVDLLGRDSGDLRLIIQPPRRDLLRLLERTGKLDAIEVEISVKGGGGHWVLLSTTAVSFRGTPHRLSVFTDIAARKRVERRLQAKHAIGLQLAESATLETSLPNVIEALCQSEGWDCGAVWLPDRDGELHCLAMWTATDLPELRAYTSAALIAAGAGLLGRVLATGQPEKVTLDALRGPHGAAAIAAGMHRAAALPILHGAEVLGVVALAARDVDAAPLDPGELGLFDSIGRLLGLFVERSRAEAALRELNAELEQRVRDRTFSLEVMNRDLEAFTSSVSHDLRAPLRTMNGFSEILLEDFSATLPEEAKRLLTSIARASVRLRDLVDHLLAFSRLGKQSIVRSEIALDPMVRSVVDELLAGKAMGQRLELVLQPLGTCRADPSLLRTVWQNLVDNALKYSRTRDRIKITIGYEVHDGVPVYFVSDNGVGFDPDHAGRLFGVFQRLHSEDEFEGTGIGLANVRRIVEWHHGRIAASSELGRGSKFEFTLGPSAG
jgi:PAS domain S-box-containing protein